MKLYVSTQGDPKNIPFVLSLNMSLKKDYHDFFWKFILLCVTNDVQEPTQHNY
jgi:hypothetical protein